MEVKLYLLLAFFGLLSSALGKGGKYRHHHHDHDRDHDQERCPMPYSSPELPLTCSLTDDCSTITCSARVRNKESTLTMKIDKSQDPLIAVIRLQVPALNFDWSHKFVDGDKIKLQSFPLEIDGFEGVTVSLQLSLKKLSTSGHTVVAYKVDMIADEYGTETTVTILKGKVPLSGDGEHPVYHDRGGHWSSCRRKFSAWWHRQSMAVKTSIIISAVIVFLLMVTGVVYCCKKRRTVATDTLKVVPPSYHEATSTDTKVPLEPLVNEE